MSTISFSDTDTESMSYKSNLSNIFDKLAVELDSPCFTELFAQLKDKSASKRKLFEIFDADNCVLFYVNCIQHLVKSTNNYLIHLTTRYVSTFIKFHSAMADYSEENAALCSRLSRLHVHQHLFLFINQPELTASSCKVSVKALHLVSNAMTILQNIIDNVPYIRFEYRASDAVSILSAFTVDICVGDQLSDDEASMRLTALFLLAAVVDEEENLKVHAKDLHIIHILKMLDDTLDSLPDEYSSSRSHRVIKILRGLIKIACPDSNKELLFKNGALRIATRALKMAKILKTKKKKEADSPAVMFSDLFGALVLELIWQLMFTSSGRSFMFYSELFLVCMSLNKPLWSTDCQQISQGIQWTLNSSRSEFVHTEDSNMYAYRPNRHIMISYAAPAQAEMLILTNELAKLGLDFWIDAQYMSLGSFSESMKQGIDGACLFVLGLCQAYKDSARCRQQILYAYELKIPFYPVLVEKNYRPDGWLRLLLATQIYQEAFNEREISEVALKIKKLLINDEEIDSIFPPESTSQLQPFEGSMHHNFSYAKESDLFNCGLRNPFSAHLHREPNFFFPDYKSSNGSSISTPDLFKSSKQSSSCPRIHDLMDKCCVPSDLMPIESISYCSSKPSFWTSDKIEALWESPSTAKSSFHVKLPSPSIQEWSAARVTQWLMEWKLEKFSKRLEELDGCLLYEWAKWSIISPNTFVKQLKSDLNCSFSEQLRFRQALSNLFALER